MPPGVNYHGGSPTERARSDWLACEARLCANLRQEPVDLAGEVARLRGELFGRAQHLIGSGALHA